MNKVRVRFITIISLFVMFAIAFGVALGLLSPAKKAYAAELTYAPSSIFWARTGGEVKAYKKAGEEAAYLTLVLGEGGSVEYHRDLALKWFEAVPKPQTPSGGNGETNGDGNGDNGTQTTALDPATLANPGQVVYFSMTLSFPKVNFEKLTIEFQSAEENVSKEEQAKNKLVFLWKDSKLSAYVVDASHAEDEEEYPPTEDELHELSAPTGDLALTFEEKETAGDFAVKIGDVEVGTFTNIGGYFMEYRTSGTANTPMTFTVDYAEDASVKSQKVMVKELNGQSLLVKGGTDASAADDDGTTEHVGGKVTDDTPAVLVMSEKLYAFTLGQRFSLSYEAIDVCDDSVSVSRSYYMLKTVDGKYHAPNESSDASNQDYKVLTTSTYFMPPDDSNDEQIEHVSIRFTLDDGRDNAEKEYVYLSWYAAEEGVVETIANQDQSDKWDYIVVDRDKKGPHYTIITTDDGEKKNEIASDAALDTNDVDGDGNTSEPLVFAEYQDALATAAKDASAGTGAYFYFPSMRSLIESDYADYRNLRFSVYYFEPGKTEGSSAASATSMRYNSLRIEIKQPGKYKFRITASDASSRSMKLYDEDGKLVDVTSSNIWDFECIPDFTFEVGYTGATIEDAGEQTQGYRGTVYNITDFDIVALGDCDKEYSLYYFDTSVLSSKPSLSELVEDTEKYMTDAAYAKAIEGGAIGEYNADIDEEDWDASYPDNYYHWDPDSSLSFVPQKSGYYIVKLHLTDPNMGGDTQDAYQVIDVRNPVDYIPGTTDWFQNNVTSVILFSISAVLAVIIVVLFVVKPSDKTVEEVDLAGLKGKKEKKDKDTQEK